MKDDPASLLFAFTFDSNVVPGFLGGLGVLALQLLSCLSWRLGGSVVLAVIFNAFR
jgi:hypothetical protein